jgi:hypothetical protein
MPGDTGTPGFKPDPKPNPELPAVKKSAVATLNDGSQLHYPTITDYVNYHISRGAVRDLDDLVNNHGHLIAEIFFHWVSTGQLGCIFALKLAANPRESRWLPIVQLKPLSEGEKLGALLNAHLDAAAESQEAAVVIFPDIKTEAEIVSLVNALCSDPSGRWYWTDDGVSPDPDGKLRLVGLRWVLQSNASVNYVLGFGSIKTMPLTRQSPFTAIFLRIKDKKMTPKDKEGGRIKVHLADLDSKLPSQEVHDQYLRLTKPYRANRVEPHMLPVARAKVTFAVSPEAATALCAPKKVEIEEEGEAH